MSSNSNLTAQARAALKSQWQDAIFLSLLYFAVCVVSDSTIVGFLLVFPICVGFGAVCLKIVRQSDETAEIKDLFMAFSSVKRLSSGVVAGLVISLIVAIGYFLFIIPGIYLSCRYAMTCFVLADNEDMSAFDAMKRSADIMDGRIELKFKILYPAVGYFYIENECYYSEDDIFGNCVNMIALLIDYGDFNEEYLIHSNSSNTGKEDGK